MYRVGRYTSIRPLIAEDAVWLYAAAAAEEIPWQWQGEPVSGDGFSRSQWQSAFQQAIVESREDSAPIGHLVLYGADFHNQRAYLSVGYRSECRGRAWPLEGLAMFVDWSFDRYPFRKLYLEAFEQRLDQFSSALSRGPFVREAVLQEYRYFRGAWSDVHVLSLSRLDWEMSPLSRLARRQLEYE